MSNFTITIVGTGVIGTSLAMALKQNDDPPRLIAHDKDLTTAKEATKMGAFDKVEWNLVNACEQADMVVLAIPLNGVKPTLEAIGPYLKENAVVTDTCPSKKIVLDWANEILPDTVHFVGGNPVVHPAGSGYKNAGATLFKDRLYCLTPAAKAHEDAVEVLTGLISLVGGEPFFLDATEHDGLMTAVEHLPSLLGVALVNTLSEQNSWRELRKLAGGTFGQASAGADGDPDGLKDNYRENKDMLLRWLDSYTVQLSRLRTLIDSDENNAGEQLAQTIDEAVVARTNWLKDYQSGDFKDPELEALSSSSVEMPGFFGRMVGFGGRRKKEPDSDKRK